MGTENGRCDRCGKKTNSMIMSYLNTQMLCEDCEKKEKQHPRYEEARRVEAEQVRSGNYNYPGLLATPGEKMRLERERLERELQRLR